MAPHELIWIWFDIQGFCITWNERLNIQEWFSWFYVSHWRRTRTKSAMQIWFVLILFTSFMFFFSGERIIKILIISFLCMHLFFFLRNAVRFKQSLKSMVMVSKQLRGIDLYRLTIGNWYTLWKQSIHIYNFFLFQRLFPLHKFNAVKWEKKEPIVWHA